MGVHRTCGEADGIKEMTRAQRRLCRSIPPLHAGNGTHESWGLGGTPAGQNSRGRAQTVWSQDSLPSNESDAPLPGAVSRKASLAMANPTLVRDAESAGPCIKDSLFGTKHRGVGDFLDSVRSSTDYTCAPWGCE